MSKSFKMKILFALCIIIFLLNTNLAFAETQGLKATKMEISVRPEYDDPRTLVVMQGEFINAGTDVVKKGTPISFIIPKDSKINMACELTGSNNENHECQPFTTKELGNDKVQITWKITKDLAPNQKYPTFLDIYYDNKAKAPNKSFEYQFVPTYSIDDTTIVLTAPKTATNFKTEPSSGNTNQDSDGLTNYVFDYKNKTSQDLISIKVSYNKNDDKPTFENLQTGQQNTQQGQTPGANNSSSLSSTNTILIAITVVLLVGLIVIALKSPKQSGNFKKVTKEGKPNNSKDNSIKNERKKIRQMLIDGKISEETYNHLIDELDD
jgi:hypothetical protein